MCVCGKDLTEVVMAEEDVVRLYRSLVARDAAGAIATVEQVRGAGVAQERLFDELFVPAMSLLGGAWAAGEVDELAFTQAAVVAEQIASFVMPPAARQDRGVSVVVGAMHRDRHAVRKNVIGAALSEAGYRVSDLGVDVRPTDFLARVEETGARILVVCAETMATARVVGRVREMLASAAHDDVVLLVAGGPFDADATLARDAGANGVLHGAESALRVVATAARDLAGGDA